MVITSSEAIRNLKLFNAKVDLLRDGGLESVQNHLQVPIKKGEPETGAPLESR
jgi:hypothetical protein